MKKDLKERVLDIALVGAMAIGAFSCTPKQMMTNINQQEVPVYFTHLVTNNIIYIYDGLEREIPLCLYGTERNGEYIVNDTQMPFLYESEQNDSLDVARARFASNSCPKVNYLGMAHNHPNGPCKPSEVDKERFENDRYARIEVIVCNADRHENNARINVTTKR